MSQLESEESLCCEEDTDNPYHVVLLPDSPLTVDIHLSPCHAITPVSTKNALSNIQDFVETTIVLKKDKKSELGISIAGGNDTYLEQVCVTEVHKDGAAYKDGRLKRGDVLLAVNDASLRDVTSVNSVKLLREASSPVRLLILRENPQTLFTTLSDPSKFITVELRKGSIKDQLGVSIVQRTNGRGVFITYVQPGSIAARHGRRILQGDQILEINGHNVRESNQKDVAHMLQQLDGNIVLLLGRVPHLTQAIQEWARRKAQQFLRTRTSTWSSYTGISKEKLQTQRPSLPVSKDIYSLAFPNCNSNVCPPGTDRYPSKDISRNSSVRSRLSIVTENTKMMHSNKQEAHTIDDFSNAGSENPLLPSICVTSF
ncbi:multiple PDZ domain protein-like isoform X1 [Centruroides vittatus]|uniref:multiple PDZ domain protein-like isoform X1 n=1 Tax=Centruroides vittatus TaxID=120091 RepID=UPI00350FF3D4